jgi:hypothetical protein
MWSPFGGLVPTEAEEVRTVLGLAAGTGLKGGLVIRPARSHETSERDAAGNVLALEIGTEGAALRDGLLAMTGFLDRFIRRRGE